MTYGLCDDANESLEQILEQLESINESQEEIHGCTSGTRQGIVFVYLKYAISMDLRDI